MERLVHLASGAEFPLTTLEETTVGRRDPVVGVFPDIDLSPLDPRHSVSVRHAKIYRRGTRFFLIEEIGTFNVTILNGTRLDTGVPAETHSGDSMRFGTVELQFQT